MMNQAISFIGADYGKTMEELLTDYLSLQEQAVNEKTSSDRLKELATLSTDLARRVVKNPCATPALLRDLGNSRDTIIRSHVAANSNTPTDVLHKLSDEFPNQVLSNPVLPLLFLENPNIIDQLFQPHTLWSIVLDAQTPKQVLGMLIHTKHTQIAEAARLHVNWEGEMAFGWHEAAREGIKSITRDQKDGERLEKLVKIGLISLLHPQASAKELAENCGAFSWLHRYAIAQHSNTSINVLMALAVDANCIVRAAANANLKSRHTKP
jgi:hypothetical protein